MTDDRRACADVRERMLEAEPGELRGSGNTPVAAHVRECTACRTLATRMLNAQDELASALSRLAPAGTPVPHPFRPARVIRVLAPLAAAAALVLVLSQPRDRRLPSLEPLPDPVALNANAPVVNVASGDDVAIMTTTNPNITIVWYLEREK